MLWATFGYRLYFENDPAEQFTSAIACGQKPRFKIIAPSFLPRLNLGCMKSGIARVKSVEFTFLIKLSDHSFSTQHEKHPILRYTPLSTAPKYLQALGWRLWCFAKLYWPVFPDGIKAFPISKNFIGKVASA